MQGVMAAASLGLALISWAASACFPGLYLPAGLRRGAHFSLVGQRGIFAAVGFAGGISEGPELVLQHFSVFRVTGPVVGGVLYAVSNSAVGVYLFNVAAALACLGLMSLVRTHHTPAAKEPVSLKTLMGGFHFVFQPNGSFWG